MFQKKKMYFCIFVNCTVGLCSGTRSDKMEQKKFVHCQGHAMYYYITLEWTHNHAIISAEALRYHPARQDIKDTFNRYFDEGMNPAAAMKFHRDCLEMDVAFREQDLADGSRNPFPRSVYHWHDKWRQTNLGTLTIQF